MKEETQLVRQLLVSVGLGEKEAVLYEILLKYGKLAAAELERRSGLKKNTYNVLKRLQRMGLVGKLMKDGKSYYYPEDPEKLAVVLKERQQELSRIESLFKEYLPKLRSDYLAKVGRPVVSYFHGEEGVLEVFERVYAPDKKVIYGCVGFHKPNRVLDKLLRYFIPHRWEREIWVKSLVNNTKVGKELFEKYEGNEDKYFAHLYMADEKEYPLPAEIDVWDGVVAMMSFENDDFKAVLIEHPEFAESLKSVFKLLFDVLKRIKENGMEEMFEDLVES